MDVQQRGSGVGAPGRILQRGTRRSMRVRVRVRLRAARARACVRASVLAHVSKPVEPSQMLMASDGWRRVVLCCNW